MNRLIAALLLSAAAGACAAERGPERPFLIWNSDDIKLISAKLKSEPWAKERLDRLLKDAPSPADRAILENYFLYLMAGDQEAGKFERQVMLHFGEVVASPKYSSGRSVEIGAGFHISNYDIAFRWDLFSDALPPDERRVCENKLHKWSSEQMKNDFEYRGGWESPDGLYNSLTAVAIGEKRLVKAAFEAPSGAKNYFDRMVDGCLSPSASNPDVKALGAMWLWCRGVQRLGLDELGFGYTGAGGGNMRRLLEGYFLVGDPRIDIPGGAPFYGRSALTLSARLRRQDFVDLPSVLTGQGLSSERGGVAAKSYPVAPLKHPREVFRAPIISGQLRDGSGGWPPLLPFRNEIFYSYDKMPRDLVGLPQIEYNPGVNAVSMGIQLPLVFELAHQRWPDAGFDYFLTRMQPPEDGKYYPSLFWGLDPIPVAATKAPAAKSVVFPTLGMALLRAQEGPGYWESPAPFAILRLTDGLGEEVVGSALSLFSFQALNRPIYRYVLPARGVPSRDLVTRGTSHNTVVVDNARRTGVGRGTVRQRFDPAVKFIAVRSEAVPLVIRPPPVQPPGGLAPRVEPPPLSDSPITEGVEMERALALTREYLLDVFRLDSAAEHTYDWIVHALGSAVPDQEGAWQPTDALTATLGITQQHTSGSKDQALAYQLRYSFGEQRRLDPQGSNWSLNAVQTTTAADPAQTIMGPEWYGRKVGVRVTMLGEPGAQAFFAREFPPRRLTASEQAILQDIRFPRRLKGRDKGFDTGDHQATEIAIPPADGEQGVEKKDAPTKLSGKDFQPVGQAMPVQSESGGVAIIAERRAARTMFVALHEPFEKMAWNLEELRRIQQTEDAVAVAIRGRAGSAVDDRVMVRLGAKAREPVTLGDGAESFTFTSFAYIRVGAEQVTVAGDLAGMKLKVSGQPKLLVNGQERKGELRDGCLLLAP